MQLRYGKGCFDFIAEPTTQWTILAGKTAVGSESNDHTLLKKGIEDLLGEIKERHFPKSGRLLVIIPDHTRRCRIDEILGRLLQEVTHIWQARCEILIANGSHSPSPDAEIQRLVGEAVFEAYPVFQHVAEDNDSLYYVGDTTYGTPIWLNKKVKEADLVVTIGGILFHYFAGFGGGPKMLLPGVAGIETIRYNHRRTIDPKTGFFHPQCQEGNIETNPVFLDLAQVVKNVPNSLSLQVVLSSENHFIQMEAGDILKVHRRLCNTVRDVYGLPIKQKVDIVIASAGGYPADVNLIQAHKSIHHAFQAVRPGGVLIMLAQCSEGVGSKYFMPYFDLGSSHEIAARLLEDYQINGHTALALKNKAEQVTIIFVSELAEEIVRKTGMIPSQSLQQAWELAQSMLPRPYRGYIFPNASKYVPFVV